MDIERIKNKLKEHFKSGDIPTEANFVALIDEALNPNAARLTEGTLANARLPEQIDLTQAGDNSKLTVKRFLGSGEGITDLNAGHIASGMVNNDYLNKSSTEQYGITKFASSAEVELGAEDLAVTAKTLKTASDSFLNYINEKINSVRSYADLQVAQLQARAKEKAFVSCVAVEAVNRMGLIQLSGYRLKTGDRVLLTQQDNKSENRVWVAAEGEWELASDFDEHVGGESVDYEVHEGTTVEVVQDSLADVQEQKNYNHSIWTICKINPVAGRLAEISWLNRNDLNHYQPGEGIEIEGLTIKANKDWLSQQIQQLSIGASDFEIIDAAKIKTGTIGIERLPYSTTVGNTHNTVPTEKAVKDFVDQQLPAGGIIMWHGSTVPDGWAICDGRNGTPNLINRFIVGAGDYYNTGEKGGLNEVTLSRVQMPKHSHSVTVATDGEHTHSGTIPSDKVTGGKDKVGVTQQYLKDTEYRYETDPSGSHNHSALCDDAGENESHENRPPYYALRYIMKLAD